MQHQQIIQLIVNVSEKIEEIKLYLFIKKLQLKGFKKNLSGVMETIKNQLK
jgi:hypothetical protein